MERKRNMRLFNVIVIILLFCFTSPVSPTTINGRFTVLNVTSSEFTVLLQINTNTGTDDLGGATIVFSFDTSAINFPNNPIKDVDYVFHNFNEGNYSGATVSKPMSDKILVNIDLPFVNNNSGTIVTANPEWTDVVTIHFDIVNPNKTSDLLWLTTSLFWGIYDADNTTLWETGVFQDLLTSVEPGSGLPTNYELEQNYPNPFNPSTKIIVELPNKTIIRLAVYNLLGEMVSEVVSGEYEAGTHEFTFVTNSLASGVYLYRIESAEFTDTKKMILLR
jgi:hypothetical protein